MILNACYIDWVVERCDKSTLKHFFWKMKFVNITLQRFYKQEANYSDGKGAWNTFASNFDISCTLSNLRLSTSSLFFCFLFLHMQFVCPFFVFFYFQFIFCLFTCSLCQKGYSGKCSPCSTTSSLANSSSSAEKMPMQKIPISNPVSNIFRENAIEKILRFKL